ncbi:MAG: hypothetical protein HZA01_02340 [Nitrospinae bacterium]|nr:hypothetical protein [Nitrospinota bacterium]
MKKHILLVSEDVAFRFTSTLTLAWDGHRVSEARDYMEAVELIGLHEKNLYPIGLLLAKLKNPNSFLLMVAAMEIRNISIPVLSVSNLSKHSSYPLLSGSCSGVAAKPMKSGDLLQCVNQFLELKEVNGYGGHV